MKKDIDKKTLVIIEHCLVGDVLITYFFKVHSMKKLISLVIICFAIHSVSLAQSVFELEANQSMLMTGKGQGQDGAINPYYGENSVAIVDNLGKTSLWVRIQSEGKILENVEVPAREKKKIVLLKGQELYFDTDEKAKAELKFQPYTE